MKPACPRENRPVKPFSRFREDATSAYTAPFFSTVNSMLVGCMVFSSTITSSSSAATHARAIHAPRLLFFSCNTVTAPFTLCRWIFSPNRPVGFTTRMMMSSAKVNASENTLQLEPLMTVSREADQKRAHHGAGNGADAAEHRRHEGPQPRQGAGQRHDGGVVGEVQRQTPPPPAESR